jgi:hypothetical protein
MPGDARAAEFDHNLSLRTDAWSGSRQLDDDGAIARASVWGRARLDLGDAGKLVGDGWLATQSRSKPGDAARLRELLWQGSAGSIDWKLGRQIVAWGRADGLNPTDNLSPRDYTVLVPQDGEQRRGNDGVQLGLDTPAGRLTALWFARAASHTLPLEALPGVRYAVQRAPRRAQWALKWDITGDGIDGSLSYFHGHDPTPDLVLAGADAAGVTVAVINQPLRVLGADISATRGGIVWRAEGAWMQTDSRGAGDFSHKKPRLWLVAGAEWTLGQTTTLGLQATLQQVRHFSSPDLLAQPVVREIAQRQAALSNQTAARQAGIVWRLASRWLNDSLWAEINGVHLGQPSSTLWRTRLTYAINDSLQLQAGTDHFSGPQQSLWGQLRRNRLAFAQLRFSL